MQAESIIHYYNRLNGNSITRDRLKDFHARVQSALDNHSHGPLVNDLRNIHKKITNFLKNPVSINGESAAGEDFIIDRIEVIPIDVTRFTLWILWK